LATHLAALSTCLGVPLLVIQRYSIVKYTYYHNQLTISVIFRMTHTCPVPFQVERCRKTNFSHRNVKVMWFVMSQAVT